MLNDFIDFFNQTTGRKYRPIAVYARAYAARIKDGFTEEEMRKATVNASKNAFLRGSNASKKDYLTPEYILRGNKLEEWLNAEIELAAQVGQQSYYD